MSHFADMSQLQVNLLTCWCHYLYITHELQISALCLLYKSLHKRAAAEVEKVWLKNGDADEEGEGDEADEESKLNEVAILQAKRRKT